MSGQLQYDSGRLWAVCNRGYAHLHKILPTGHVEKTWPVYHEARSDALVHVGGMAPCKAGLVLADRGLACLHVVPRPRNDSLLRIAQTVDLSTTIREVVAVSSCSDGRVAVCSETSVLVGDPEMRHFASLPELPSHQGILLDIQWTGPSLWAVANLPSRIYRSNAREAYQWQEVRISEGFEPVLCAAVGNTFTLLGRYGAVWAVSCSDGKTIEMPISHDTLPIGFTWFADRYGIVCEKERGPDQEVLVCDVTGALLASAPLP